MKRLILLLVAAFCGLTAVSAQDMIVKVDDTKIEAKVTEITVDAVRYKRFSNPDGPTYVLPIVQIRYIQYANGERDDFGASVATEGKVTPVPQPETVPMTPLQPAQQPQVVPATPLQPAQQSEPVYVLKVFELGGLYDHNGLKGIICMLDDSKQHGLLMSLDEIYLMWSDFRKPDLRVVGTDNRTDGMANMAAVEDYIKANNLSWDDFPAFKWCREKGDGWYLPSIDEMLNIGHNYNGGTRLHNNRQARNKFNDTLKESGGERMDRLVYYFSSTESDEKEALTSHMGIEPPYVVNIPKYNKFLVRAVHKF